MAKENISKTNRKSQVRIIKQCEFCGNVLEKRPSEVKFNKTKTFFCSQDCFHKWQGGKNNANWKGGKVTVSCQYCGNEIRRDASAIKRYPRHFCSARCRELGKRTLVDVECENCGKGIQKLKAYVDKYEHMFCCRKCRHVWMRGENNPAWKGGLKLEPYCQIWNVKDFREEIKERDSYRCTNPYCTGFNSHVLSLHHINYDKKDCNPKNLITICRSCNSRANVDRRWHRKWYETLMNKRYGYAY